MHFSQIQPKQCTIKYVQQFSPDAKNHDLVHYMLYTLPCIFSEPCAREIIFELNRLLYDLNPIMVRTDISLNTSKAEWNCLTEGVFWSKSKVKAKL